jgi:ABC-type multidrug transport system fused ATPase/permease subunit
VASAAPSGGPAGPPSCQGKVAATSTSPRASASGADAAHRTWRPSRLHLPLLFQAPPDPVLSAPIRVDQDTTPARLTRRVILGSPAHTIPASLLLMGHQIGEALVPVLVGLAIDRALSPGDVGALVLWTAVLAADFLLLSFTFRFGSRLGLLGMQKVQHRVRMMVTEHLLDPHTRTGVRDGAGLSIATSDVLRLAAAMQLGVYPPGEIASVLFCAITLGVIWWPLGLAVLVGGLVLMWAMTAAGGPLRSRSLRQQELAAAAVAQAGDLVAGYRVIRGLRAETGANARYRSASQDALAGTLRAKTSLGIYLGSMDAFAAVFVTVLVGLAGYGAVAGHVSAGSLIAVVGLTQFLIGPLRALPANVGAIWAVGTASARRVLGVLLSAGSAEPSLPADDASPTGGLVPRLEVMIAERGTVRVDPGRCIGVRTDQATGLRCARLLAGVGEVDDTLWVDDSPAPSGSGRVLVAPHAAELFDGSITWNLDVPGADPSRRGICLHDAACDDFLADLPEGLDTPVGEGGTRLSGGQRQRLALARAYAADPPVLVLHEPTTAVDSVTASLIASRLRDQRAGRTTVLITDAPGLLAVCDQVVDLTEEETA